MPPAPPTKKRAAIYARKSPGESKGASVPYQLDWATDECDRLRLALNESLGVWIRNGEEIPRAGGAYIDEGAHGGSLVRDGLWRMLEDARSGYFDVLLVFRADRLSRSRDAQSLALKALAQFGVRVYSTDNPDGSSLIAGFTGVLAENEVRVLRQRTKEALREVGKEKNLGRPPKGFLAPRAMAGGGKAYIPRPEAEALYSLCRSGTPVPGLLASPEAAALGVRSGTALGVFRANMRAYQEGTLDALLERRRGGTEGRLKRLRQRERAEEHELMKRLVDLVPDLLSLD